MLQAALNTAEATFAGLLGLQSGGPVAVAVTDPRDEHGGAFPEELAELPRAVDSRRREYLAGRIAAHRAMEKLGLAARPVLSSRSRAPVWPRGLVGSLSHNATTCVAVVARASQVRSLGVDVEDDSPLPADLIATVCTLDERAWLASRPEVSRRLLAKLIFSAKEAVYKCQFPISRKVIDFTSVLVTPDMDTGQFEATFLEDAGAFRVHDRLTGRFAISDHLIHTAMVFAPNMASA